MPPKTGTPSDIYRHMADEGADPGGAVLGRPWRGQAEMPQHEAGPGEAPAAPVPVAEETLPDPPAGTRARPRSRVPETGTGVRTGGEVLSATSGQSVAPGRKPRSPGRPPLETPRLPAREVRIPRVVDERMREVSTWSGMEPIEALWFLATLGWETWRQRHPHGGQE